MLCLARLKMLRCNFIQSKSLMYTDYYSILKKSATQKSTRGGDSQELILERWQVASSEFFLPKIVPEVRILWKTVTNYCHIWLITAKYGQNLQLVNGPKSTLEIVVKSRKNISRFWSLSQWISFIRENKDLEKKYVKKKV